MNTSPTTRCRDYEDMECKLRELCDDNSLNCLFLEHAGKDIKEDEVIVTIQRAFDLYGVSDFVLSPRGLLNAKMPQYIEALIGDENVSELICIDWVMDYLPDISFGDPIPTFSDTTPNKDAPPWRTT